MARTALCLLGVAGSLLAESPEDRTVLELLRRAAPAIQDSTVIKRLTANDDLDLVVALGWPRKFEAIAANEWPWSTQDRLGLFLQDRRNSGLVFRLAIEPGPNDDCYSRIQHVTAQDLVLSCTGEKSSVYDNQKFVYDIRAKALVKHYAYPPFSATRVVQGPGGGQFVMSDGQRVLLVEVDAATGIPRVIPEGEVRSGGPDPVTNFGPGKRFELSQQKNTFGSDFPVILERIGRQANAFRLPQSDEKTWRDARPDDAAGGLAFHLVEMNEQIGPHQLEGDRLWFGKTFYNSEGATGVGGFGYFDAATAAWRMYSPPGILKWSVSAMLVEPGVIWMALYRRGEYGNTPGGLLRWDRNTEQAEIVDPRITANSIARCGGALCLGADGISVLQGRDLKSYFVDQTTDGHYRMAVKEGAQR